MSREGSSAGSTVQQSAPSSDRAGSSAGQMSHEPIESTKPESTKPSSGMKATQSEQKSPMAGKNERAEDMQGQKSKSMSSENNAKGGSKEIKAEGREGRNGNVNAESKSTAESKSQTTTGQAGAGAGAKLSTEQRTKITSVIKEEHVAPVTNVNFSISVGTRVPREVSFHPLPAEIVTVYPDWRGYEFFLVRDQIVVVNPRTLEIVAVLEA